MDDRKVYTDINRIINSYVVKEEDEEREAPTATEVKAEQDSRKATQSAIDVKKEQIQKLQDQIKELQSKLNEDSETQSEDHKPGEDYEYDYEGSMAKTQLCQIHQAATKLMKDMDDNENLPEWVQSKIAVACDYMIKIASYLDASEEQDQQAMEKKPAIQMPNLPKPPAVSGMMSNALGSRPAVGISLGSSANESEADNY